MMKKLKEAVKPLVESELLMASKDHGDRFHSAHEAYAVILEEYEEAKESFDYVDDSIETFWGFVMTNDNRHKKVLLDDIESKAIHTACECIQIAAMARKAQVEYGDSKHE